LRKKHNKPEDVSSTCAAIKILDERYAEGEISDEEYKNKKFNMR
jgi:uncharacterized membrane protein